MKLFLSKYIEYILFFCLILFAFSLLFVKKSATFVMEGISLWALTVVPSLFPYLFITSMLSSLRATKKISSKLSPLTVKLFNVNGIVGYAFFMSIMAGYPIGAKIVSDLKKANLLSDAESVRASAFCSTSSPMFLISSVGKSMFKNSLFGIILFLLSLITSIIMGIIFSFYKRKERATSKNQSFSPVVNPTILYDSVFSSVISILCVGGLITLFYLLTEVLNALNLLYLPNLLFELLLGDKALALGLTTGLFECTKGLKLISCSVHGFLTLPVCALLCGFGGISVIAQSVAFLKGAKIKTAPFILSKIISAVINFVLAIIVCLLFGCKFQ